MFWGRMQVWHTAQIGNNPSTQQALCLQSPKYRIAGGLRGLHHPALLLHHVLIHPITFFPLNHMTECISQQHCEQHYWHISPSLKIILIIHSENFMFPHTQLFWEIAIPDHSIERNDSIWPSTDCGLQLLIGNTVNFHLLPCYVISPCDLSNCTEGGKMSLCSRHFSIKIVTYDRKCLLNYCLLKLFHSYSRICTGNKNVQNGQLLQKYYTCTTTHPMNIYGTNWN